MDSFSEEKKSQMRELVLQTVGLLGRLRSAKEDGDFFRRCPRAGEANGRTD